MKKINSKLFDKSKLSGLTNLNQITGGNCDSSGDGFMCGPDKTTELECGHDLTECGPDSESLTSGQDNSIFNA